MAEQPGAGRLDPETLAAYVDGLLPPEERARVEAEIAADPEDYEWLVNSINAVDDGSIVATGDEPVRRSSSDCGPMAGPTPTPAPMPARRTTTSREPGPHGGSDVPAKVLPFYRRRAVLAGAGALVAAAASLLLVVQLQPEWWQRWGGPQVDPRFAKLVEAVGEERYIEARLTGGFKYGPLRQVMRGPGDLSSQNLQLLAAAGELQKAVEKEPSAANLHAWGAAQLLLADPSGAVRSLRQALAVQQDPAVATDLAAAYLARSQVDGVPADAVLALKLMDEGTGGQLTTEGLFNRALALERIGDRAQARAGWTRYISAEPDERWRKEAERRLEALGSAPSSRQGGRSPLLPTEMSPQVLQDTAQCLAEARNCEHLVSAVVATASVELAATGDRLPTALAERLRDLTGHGNSALEAFAIVTLMQVVNAADEDERATAVRLLSTLRPLPDALGYRDVLDVYRVVATSDAPDFPGRIAGLELLASSAVDQNYLRLAAVAYNWAALGHTRAGRLEAALAARLRSLALYVSVGDAALVAELHALVAEHYRLTSAWDGAWRHHRESFLALQSVASPRTVHVVYAHAALTAIAMDAVPLATLFQTALLDNARAWDFPAALVAASSQRAKSNLLSGRPQEALADVAEARVAIARMAPSDYTERVRSELLEADAAARVAMGGADGVVAAEEALQTFQLAGFGYRLVGANVLLSDAHAAVGDRDAAARATREALRQWTSEARAVRDDQLAQSLDASLQRLSWQLAEIAATRQDAFEIAEAVDTGHAFHFEPVAFGRQVMRLPLGHCALVYSDTVRSGLVAAMFAAGTGRAATLGLSRPEVQRLVQGVRTGVQFRSADVPQRLADARVSLLAPFEAELESCATLTVVPTDELSGLPFAALPNGSGRPLYSATAVALELTAWNAVQGWSSPAFTAPQSVWILGSAEQGEGSALPAVAEELRAVSRAYSAAAATIVDRPTPELFETAFARADVLHFAGHAVAHPRRSSMSYLRLSGALGNYRLGQLRDSKRGPSVVVLAACQTAFAGDGQEGALLGMARAALDAGARSVVGTLWDVADSDVAAFSQLLHAELSAGAAPPEALKRAQIKALNTNAIAPNTVAAFVVAGTRT